MEVLLLFLDAKVDGGGAQRCEPYAKMEGFVVCNDRYQHRESMMPVCIKQARLMRRVTTHSRRSTYQANSQDVTSSKLAVLA